MPRINRNEECNTDEADNTDNTAPLVEADPDAAASSEEQNPETAAPETAAHASGQLPLYPPIAIEPLAEQAKATAEKHLNAAAQAEFFSAMIADDQLLEVASRRGLLCSFTIRFPLVMNPPPPIEVDAPEFATIDYLKRRITRAKLLRGEFLLPEKFALKRPAQAPSDGQAVGSSMEYVPETGQVGGVKPILFNLGFTAQGKYELSLTSAKASTDKVQQEMLLKGAGQAGKVAELPLSSSPAKRAYQEMLGGQQPKRTPAPDQAGPSGVAPPPLSVPQVVTAPSSSNVAPSPTPRRSTGRWTPEEVTALIQGVQAFGFSWATIHDRFSGTAISERRSTVDYKDKWRNLVLAVKEGKQMRGLALSEDTKTLILRIAATNGAGKPMNVCGNC